MQPRSILTGCTLILSLFLQAQLTQSLSGRVIDKETRRPLQGATVSIADDSIRASTISNADGSFWLKDIPVGRRRVQCSFSGYEDFISDNLIINSAREQEMLIELSQVYRQQAEVIVKARRNPKAPVNKSSVVSTRSFTPEETQRYAASVNDPGRMAMSFPGVQPVRDARSDIIIRGNASSTMLWRLEGIDIPNPNHFARKGSSGGGITVFSSSMLDNSDFSTGGFPAEYGDALSGVFDMRFRKGNKDRNQYTFKASLIGLEFAAEGPIQKARSSYLVNARYSTLGILNSIGFHLTGERENNSFQDLSFNLNFPSSNKKGNLNMWGIGGLSKEDYSELEDVNDWNEYDDYAIYDFRTNMGALGLTYNLQTGRSGVWRSSVAIMGQRISFVDDTLDNAKNAYTVNDELYKNSRFSLATHYNTRISERLSWKLGIFGSLIGYTFNRSFYDYMLATYRQNVFDGDGNAWQWQPYTQFTWKPSGAVNLNAGIHVLYLSLNQTTSIEPRFNIQYRPHPNHTVSFSTGLYGKVLPLGAYFYKGPADDYPNKSLDIMRSAHFITAYDLLMNKGWRLHVEAYLQKLSRIPVANHPDLTFWLLNMIDGYPDQLLVSKGKGKNMGVDITLEKFFSRGLFVLSNLSVFSSRFQPLNGRTYNTQYNSKTAASLTAGREWKWKKEAVFTLGGKALYNGGVPITPLLNGAAINSRDPVLDESRPFSIRVPAYFRADARVSLRRDKKNMAWMLALDIQNIAGIKNTDGLNYRYDPVGNKWIYKKLSGFVPVVSYQIDF